MSEILLRDVFSPGSFAHCKSICWQLSSNRHAKSLRSSLNLILNHLFCKILTLSDPLSTTIARQSPSCQRLKICTFFNTIKRHLVQQTSEHFILILLLFPQSEANQNITLNLPKYTVRSLWTTLCTWAYTYSSQIKLQCLCQHCFPKRIRPETTTPTWSSVLLSQHQAPTTTFTYLITAL